MEALIFRQPHPRTPGDPMATDIVLTQDEVQLIGQVSGRSKEDAEDTFKLDTVHGNLRLGRGQQDGDVFLDDGEGKRRVHLSAGEQSRDASVRVLVDGSLGNVTLGGDDADGDLVMLDGHGTATVHITAGGGPIQSTARVLLDAEHGVFVLRNHENDVILDVRGNALKVTTTGGMVVQAGHTLTFLGPNGAMVVGGGKRVEITPGDVKVHTGDKTISLTDLEERVAALEG